MAINWGNNSIPYGQKGGSKYDNSRLSSVNCRVCEKVLCLIGC
jgi:hypothetical protein